MANLKISATGMPWYTEEDYPELLKLFTDGPNLPATYSKWLASAQTGETHMQNQGARVVRALIRPEEFAAWCAERSIRPDAAARLDYASKMAYRAVV